jgi:hypothetical protein
MISSMNYVFQGVRKHIAIVALFECLPSVLLWTTRNLENPKPVMNVSQRKTWFLAIVRHNSLPASEENIYVIKDERKDEEHDET